MFLNRGAKFIASACQHNDPVVQTIVDVASRTKSSVFRENISHVCEKLGIDEMTLGQLQTQTIKSMVSDLCNKHCKNKALNVIVELCKVRDGLLDCILTNDEINEFINFLSTN